MTKSKLIEAYGRKFTPLSRIAIVIAIAIAGILIAFNHIGESPVTEGEPAVEQSWTGDPSAAIISLTA